MKYCGFSAKQRRTLQDKVSWEVILTGLAIPFKKQPSGTLVALCGWHRDNRPSLNFKEKTYICYSCGETGDMVDFISHHFKTEQKQTIRCIVDTLIIKSR